jgi:acyl-CoA reductase-like NAD-dependent aldehyde dehydrogenase
VRSYIELGVSEGATLLGEIPPKEPKGFFVKPTIFTNTREDMRIVKEEIFGPVAVLCKFKTITEVLSKANDSHYGLGAAVFSQNIDTCLALANGIDAGTVWVNHILLDVYS